VKARNPEFLHNPHVMRLRVKLMTVCKEMLRISRKAKMGKDGPESALRHDTPEYQKLAKERDWIIGRLHKEWHG
jgi:hypothetical protein